MRQVADKVVATVTGMFTDLVDSTALMSRVGESAATVERIALPR